MPIDDRMTIDERRKHLRKIQERYLQAIARNGGQLLGKRKPPPNSIGRAWSAC